MTTFHGIDNMWLRSPYSIDIEEMEAGIKDLERSLGP